MRERNEKSSRFSEFWYYHKVKVIAIFVATAIVAILTTNALVRPFYDLKVFVWCNDESSYLDVDALEHVFAEHYAFDRNGDGKVNVLVKNGSATGGMSFMPETERTAALQDPETFLFLVDDITFEFLLEVLNRHARDPEVEIRRVFTDLEKLYSNGPGIEDVRLHLQGSVFQEKLSEGDPLTANYIGGLFFVVQNPSGGSSEKNKDAYNDAIKIVEKIINE